MKQKTLLFAVIIMSVLIPQSVKAYDFSYTHQGKTLFYSIEWNGVRVDNPMSDNFYGYVTGVVVIPDSVENSGIKYAVTHIGDYAFYGCSGLTSVTIGNSVTEIGYSSFYGCTGFTSVTIPNSVTSIGVLAFGGCSGLTSVTIGNSVTTIGGGAFGYCSSLTSVTIGNSVTTIGSDAFQYCSGLTSITIPSSVTSIGAGAFYGCGSLTSIAVESGNTHYDSRGNCNAIIQTDLNLLIKGCQNTTIPNTVIAIGNHAFLNCCGLTSISIPNSVVSIGGYAFYNCSGLTSLSIPNSVTSISNGAFSGCTGLTSITIPNSVTSIGSYTFDHCSGLTSITIPNSVTTIGNGVFTACSGLTSLIIPNSVTTIGNSAFTACSGLTSIIIPNSVTDIGEDAFYNCSGLTSVNIPNSVTSIGRYAFSFCSGLTSVTIPNSVTSIGDGAFQNCSGLTAVYCKATTPPTLGDNAFNGNHYRRKIYVPCTFASAYHNATNWSSYSSKIYGKNYWEHLYYFSVDNDEHGSVSYGEPDCDSNITVTANANIGFQHVGWSDGGTGTPRTFHLTGDTTVTALFDFASYTIIVQPNDVARGFVTGSDTVHYGDTVILSATASYGYHFAQWNDGNTGNPRLVTVTQSAVFTAQFDKNSYTLSVETADNVMGGVNGSNTAEYLDAMTFSATPNYGYHFTIWNDGDTNNPRTITLTQDTAFTAFFAKNSYTLTVQANDTTLGEVTGSATVEYLDTVSITATVTMPHYHFVQWSDGNTEATRNVVITCDSVITAIFAIDTHSVTLMVNDNNYGTVNGACSVPYGTDVTVAATATDGYHFAEWNNGSRENPYTITVTGDTLLTAIFTDDVVTQICMVSVQDGHNVVVWEQGLEVTAYNIYRESSVTDVYELVASIPYDSIPLWVDTASRPAVHSYRYRMTSTDIYGYESEPSNIHKTMHLTISQGIGNRWNLVWTEYEGASYTTYVIYRGTNTGNIQQIDVMAAGGNTTYTDENAPEGDVYYQVGVMMSTPCNSTKTSSISLSNIATNGSTEGIQNIVDFGNFRVYSEYGEIVVEGVLSRPVQVFDMMGRTLYTTANNSSFFNEHITIPVSSSGIYLVKIGDYPARKVVVVK